MTADGVVGLEAARLRDRLRARQDRGQLRAGAQRSIDGLVAAFDRLVAARDVCNGELSEGRLTCATIAGLIDAASDCLCRARRLGLPVTFTEAIADIWKIARRLRAGAGTGGNVVVDPPEALPTPTRDVGPVVANLQRDAALARGDWNELRRRGWARIQREARTFGAAARAGDAIGEPW